MLSDDCGLCIPLADCVTLSHEEGMRKHRYYKCIATIIKTILGNLQKVTSFLGFVMSLSFYVQRYGNKPQFKQSVCV